MELAIMDDKFGSTQSFCDRVKLGLLFAALRDQTVLEAYNYPII